MGELTDNSTTILVKGKKQMVQKSQKPGFKSRKGMVEITIPDSWTLFYRIEATTALA